MKANPGTRGLFLIPMVADRNICNYFLVGEDSEQRFF